ncbi:AMP-binding protein [Alcaligenaceae bacterium]|nr:AMP-binding protein [Alcaligenaceae bacterium]
MNDKLISCELLGQLPHAAAGTWGDRKALIYKGQSWTYQQFEDEVQVAASALASAGVRPGDRVALWLPNCPALQFLLFATTRIGAVAVPLNTRYKSMELRYALLQSGSTLVISATRAGPVDLDGILKDVVGGGTATEDSTAHFSSIPALKGIIMIGDSQIPGHTPWAAFRDSGWNSAADYVTPTIMPSDIALMLFTSGTSGQPKGVLLNHAGLKLCHDRARIMRLSKDDIQLTYLPLFHIYAFGYSVMMSLMSGATQVLMDVFKGEEALRLIHEHRVTVLHGFEAHFSDLFAARNKLDLDVSSLRIASFATGAKSVTALAEIVQEALCETSSSYGLTETWGGITISPPGATLSQRCESSGLPQPGIEVRIVDPNSGCVLPTNTIGEIQVRSYALFTSYHDDPAETERVIDADGWFRTGDAGILRDDGYLRCLARFKDMLKVGGENVAPAEIEGLLCEIPGVRAAAVVGQKNDRLEEVPVAFIVAQPNECPGESEIIEYFRGKIANFKIPTRVIFIEELPMTSTGKVQKELLRKRLLSDAASDQN